MHRAICNICFDILDISVFRILHCGHGFCKECMEIHKKAFKSCPICRAPTPKGSDGGHPIYIELVDNDTLHSKVKDVKAELSSKDVTAEYVERVSKKMKLVQQIGESVRGQDGLPIELLSTFEDFQSRIAPVFRSLEDENKTLVRDVKQLTAQLRTAESKNTHLHRMGERYKSEIKSHEKMNQDSVNLAGTLNEENKALKQEMSSLRAEAEGLRKEFGKYKAWLEESKRMTSSMKAKLKGLKEENKKLKQDAESERVAEESLVIVPGVQNLIARDMTNPWQPPSSESDDRGQNMPGPDDDLYDDSMGAEDFDIDLEPDYDMAAILGPHFRSDWKIQPQSKKRKLDENDAAPFPIKRDTRGRALGTVQLGSRQRMGANQ